MKTTLLLLAAVGLLAATAGCNQSNNADENPPVATNSDAQSVSNAWQDTKGAATNAWNATKDGATNVWNKTTNTAQNP